MAYKMNERELQKRFNYHAPKDGQPERYELIRGTARDLARLIGMSCPESRERALAMTKIEEAVAWAVAAISRNE